MKTLAAFTILLSSFVFSSLGWAAPAADKAENKDAKTLQELNYKYERLIQLDYARHQEVLRQLKEIRELAKKPNPPAELPNAASTSTPAAAPIVMEASSPTQTAAPVTVAATTEAAAPAADKPVEAAPTAATTPVAAAAVEEKPTAEPVAGTSTPVTPSAAPEKEVTGRETAEQPAAVEVTTTPTVAAATPSVSTSSAPAPAVEAKEAAPVVIPPEVLQGIHESESYAILAIIFSVISLGSMGFLIYTVRKSDERLRRMLWKSEVDHLRDEVMGGRPVLKVEKSFDRLLLTNTGTVIADDIKLSLGPAPATMKQRLRVLAKIAAGEKAEVEIGAQTENQIYGTLEYKNPENDRTYKEQFTLKIDSVTGELVPIQQAV